MTTESLTLDMLSPGEKGIIRNIIGHLAEENRLMEMGVMVGSLIRLVKFAPLGDPIELRVRNYHLSIRRSEARNILIEKVED